MGVVKIGSARIDERGKIIGKGKINNDAEISYHNWYLPSKGWVVIRAKDENVRKRIAEAMRSACINNNISYSKTNRNDLFNKVKIKDYDPAKCEIKAVTDCSALIRTCICFALNKIIPDFNTSIEKIVLEKTGYFDIITDPKYTTKSRYLLEGDILVTKIKGHSVVVLNDGDGDIVNKELNDDSKPVMTDPIKIATYTLKKGAKGNNVKTLQNNLNMAINANIKVNGIFDTETEDAVKEFQKKYNIKVSGVYNKDTYNKIKFLLNV